MQFVDWVLTVLDGPDDQWAVECFHIEQPVGELALTALLPAGCQAMAQRQMRLTAVATDGLAQQQPGHHPADENHMALIADGAVLMQKADELTVEPGSGIDVRLDWCDSPNPSC